jgi:hypothetical protein
MDTLLTIASLLLASALAAGAALLIASRLRLPAMVARLRARAVGLAGWTLAGAAAAFLLVGVLLMTGLLGGAVTLAWAGAGLWLCIVGPIVATALASPESPASAASAPRAAEPSRPRRAA